MKTQTIVLTMIFCIVPTLFYANVTSQSTSTDVIKGWEVLVALIPVILYLLISMMVFRKLRKDKITLKELLLDKDMIIELEVQKTKQAQEIAKTVSKLNPNDMKTYLDQTVLINAANGDSLAGDETQKSSISRLLAFISGLTSVGLACAITTFYMWNYFDDKAIIDLNGLLTVLLSLGIGVIPYAFNKIGNAVGKP